MSEARHASRPGAREAATAVRRALARYAVYRVGLTVIAATAFLRAGGGFGPALLWRPWVQLESYWYIAIAAGGYRPLLRVPVGAHVYSGTEFSPALPAAMAGLHAATAIPLAIAGLLVCGLAAIACLALLDRYLDDLGLSDAERRWTAIALLAWPASLFFNSVYTEPIQLGCLLVGLIQARRGHHLLAGIAIAVAVLTKSVDIVFMVPLAAVWWLSRERRAAGLLACVVPGILALAGLFWGFGILSGDPLDLIHAAAGWNHSFSPPWDALGSGLETVLHPVDGWTQAAGRVVDVVAIGVLACGCWLSWRRRELVHGLLMGALLAVFLLDGDIEGSARRLVLAFPLFMYAGEYLAGRSRRQRLALLAPSVLLLAGFTAVFATGHLV